MIEKLTFVQRIRALEPGAAIWFGQDYDDGDPASMSGVPVWLTIVVAIIGVAAVLAGGFVQAWRDDRRWTREREIERARWRREERARWFDIKVETFNRFLQVMDDWSTQLFNPAFVLEGASPETFSRRAQQYLNQIRWMADAATVKGCLLYWLSLCGVSMLRAHDAPESDDERRRELVELEPVGLELVGPEVVGLENGWAEIFDRADSSLTFDEVVKMGVWVFRVRCISAVRREMIPPSE